MRVRKPCIASWPVWQVALGAVVTWLLVLSVACVIDGGGESVSIKNRSDQVILVYENNVPIELLHPGVSQDFPVLPDFEGTEVFEVRALDSRETLVTRSFTWKEIHEAHGITIHRGVM